MSRQLRVFRMQDVDGNDMGQVTVEGVYIWDKWEKIEMWKHNFIYNLWYNYYRTHDWCEHEAYLRRMEA